MLDPGAGADNSGPYAAWMGAGQLVGDKLIIPVADWETLVGWSIVIVIYHFSWLVGKFIYFQRNHQIVIFVVVGV